jgi:hypothetical protein
MVGSSLRDVVRRPRWLRVPLRTLASIERKKRGRADSVDNDCCVERASSMGGKMRREQRFGVQRSRDQSSRDQSPRR